MPLHAKTEQCSVSCPPGMQKVEGQKKIFTRETVPHFQNCGAAPGRHSCSYNTIITKQQMKKTHKFSHDVTN